MYNQKPLPGDLLDYGNWASHNLAGLWFFNEDFGNKVYDLSGNGNTATFGGNVAWVPGKFGSCLNFPGGEFDKGSATIQSITGNFSFVTWFKLNSYVANGAIIDGVYNADYLFGYFTGNKVRFYVNGFNNVAESTKADFDTDIDWHQLAGTFDGQNIRIYIDGVQDGIDASTTYPTGRTTFDIGAYDGSGTLDGKIDHILAYHHGSQPPLSASEIVSLYYNPFQMVRTRRRRIITEEIAAAPPTTFPYYYREIASRRIA